MGRKDTAAELLRQGLLPSEIAQRLGTSTSAVVHYLYTKIGEGAMRRSDVAFAVPRAIRAAIEEEIERGGSLHAATIARQLRRRGVQINRFDVAAYINFRRARFVLGDMYEMLRELEVRLHRFVREAFTAEFGEEQWWRSGVPDTIRAECAALREKDPEPAEDPFAYTHLISLREILDKRWTVLSKYVPKELLNRKKELMERLLRLNRIRNSVMHPVRQTALAEDDFEFVRELAAELGEMRVQAPPNEEVPKDDAGPAPPPEHEVVAKLAAVNTEAAAPEEASTADQAAGPPDDHQDFIPSTKSA